MKSVAICLHFILIRVVMCMCVLFCFLHMNEPIDSSHFMRSMRWMERHRVYYLCVLVCFLFICFVRVCMCSNDMKWRCKTIVTIEMQWTIALSMRMCNDVEKDRKKERKDAVQWYAVRCQNAWLNTPNSMDRWMRIDAGLTKKIHSNKNALCT